MSAPARYLPSHPFPAYAYIPGQQPHPVRDPRGHSYGATEPDEVAVAAADWARSEDFLYGIDLFNHGYYWEAHEAWEGLWRAAPDPEAKAMLHGLIKLAAAGVKARVGNPRGVARHAAGAVDLFKPLEGPLYGLDPQVLRDAADALAAEVGRGYPPSHAGLEIELRPA